jgi:glycosyltransferase involved in cell wall biosynthesis
MRIVIDLQGCQSESRYRGIGRCSLAFATAVARQVKDHELWITLNGSLSDSILSIRDHFFGLVPQDRIRVFEVTPPVKEVESGNSNRARVSELLREHFLASLQPDIVHVSSLFEGFCDDSVTSCGQLDESFKTSMTLYDLIPLAHQDFFSHHAKLREWYFKKLESYKKIDYFFAISSYTKQEAIALMHTPADKIAVVPLACEKIFTPQNVSVKQKKELFNRHGIDRNVILYSPGGFDERKNFNNLFKAYALLPPSLRKTHQLVITSKVDDQMHAQVNLLAHKAGLAKDELKLTGYVSDNDLIALYSLARLFVFPSLSEGFGLPLLEAMSCGAPVLGSNTSSIPEVIGMEDALFDPFEPKSIAGKITQALGDESFLSALREHGLQQAKHFSWDRTACKAIESWEFFYSKRIGSRIAHRTERPRTRFYESLATYVSSEENIPLTSLSACIAQNEITGIERQLLIDVSELINHDAATGVQRVVKSYLKKLLFAPPPGFRIEPVYASRENGYRYASAFREIFLGQNTNVFTDEQMQWKRGDIFFGLDMQHHVQISNKDFYKQLQREGVIVKFLVYDLLPIQLPGSFRDINAKELHEDLLTMIAATDGAICISKATADAYEEWIQYKKIDRGPHFTTDWVHLGGDLDGSKMSKGMPQDAQKILHQLQRVPSFLCVATIEPRKGQQQMLDAFQLLWDEHAVINLVFVGRQGWQCDALVKQIRRHPELGCRLFWLEGISDEYLEQVYSSCACLLAGSINEGFGLPLVEAASHNKPIIARDIPVFREIAGDHAFYFSGAEPKDLADAITAWRLLFQKGLHPKTEQFRWATWRESAEELKIALVDRNYPRQQLLVDISELVNRDAKTGIQRVVRSILGEWLTNPPRMYRVEPVYASKNGYRYARKFINDLHGIQQNVGNDEPIEYAAGDVFFGLDLQPQAVTANRQFYLTLRRHGVLVYFMVYDLLCVQMPRFFAAGSAEAFTSWLTVVAENDCAVCISRAVANELSVWTHNNGETRRRPLRIEWCHIGADIDNSMPTKGLPADAQGTLARFRDHLSFLMVGTLEPRKGHVQVLDAFDVLWANGDDVILVIVGKQGWMVENISLRLRSHPELNRRLFWLEGISDEYLENVYSSCSCLIAASFGEGFGLPLIEAAMHKIPIIARDLPVFHEVAGIHAHYFSANDGAELASSIRLWKTLYEKNSAPSSVDLPYLSWKQSAKMVMNFLTQDKEFTVATQGIAPDACLHSSIKASSLPCVCEDRVNI